MHRARASLILVLTLALAGCGSGRGDAGPPGGTGDAGDDAASLDASADATSGQDGSGDGSAGDDTGTDASAAADSGSDAGGGCGPCDTPPDGCHAKQGTCQGGQCTYAFVTGATCDDGDPCTVADTCANGGCYGTPMVCDTPPAAVCLSSTESETYDAQGTCKGGLCVYDSHTTTCTGGSCQNGTCSTDPCAGITCTTPPSVCYTSPGVCSAGSCSYAYADGASCDDGNACTTNDQCNTGVCKGTPLSCSSPPPSVCANASTLKAYAPTGTCSAGSCSYTYSFVSCPAGCANGACNPTGWATMTSNTTQPLYGVWGSSASNVWAVGESGTTVLYDGTQWQVRPVPQQAVGAFMVAVHGTAANNVFALAGKVLIRFDGSQWSVVADLSTQPYCSITTGLFATGDANDDVYVSCYYVSSDLTVDEDYLYEVSGAGAITSLANTQGNIGCVYHSGGVWAFSPTDVWMGGCPAELWNGSALSPIGTGGGGTEIWAAGPQSVFTLSYDTNADGSGYVGYWNGSTWSPLNSGLNGTLSGIGGTSASRVFASGYDASNKGAIVYYDGVGFTQQVLPAGVGELNAIWAAPTGEVFAVGAGGTILKGP